MQAPSYSIDVFQADYESQFWEMLDQFRFPIDREYYTRCLERHKNQEVSIILAIKNSKCVGYCILNWQPKYVFFKKLELPEIQDLNVVESERRQRIGQSIVQYCESLVQEKGYEELGIGVGLDSSFGAAQRLYAKLGYVPDGNGVTYDRKPVLSGEFRPIDENLSLMMTKKLILK